ncbi:hypothetical protein PVAP13_9KG029826 [Panicum virgatum]|uniref:SWIM-type domain-containing protein n=2 Tax=Panicum virgatum TaxID=38727 RepID=A0A8T0NBA1_PANVG|nr:hypothetical protein PVAP13_9KG029826 [Panicum virgatum]
MGFDVRKRYKNVSRYDGEVTSCRYVCSNEGHRRKGQSDNAPKLFRAETRTDYKARMSLILDREAKNYEVTDVVLEHNHLLHLPETRHLMVSQRKISELQVFEIETADDSGIRPKAARELASRQVGGSLNLSYTIKVKEKWAECYMRNVYTLGVRSTQLSESFNNALKNHLKSDFDIVRFLKHFERTVQEKRDKELEAEFEARKKIPRRLMSTPMLMQASKVYTPAIFEAFQSEYERSMAACSKVLDGNTYGIAIGSLNGDIFEEERIVTCDPSKQIVSCSCGMFSRTGILCAHGLKVLDLINTKTLPAHYILPRWTREACKGNIQDSQGRNVVANPKLEAHLRYRSLSHKFLNLAYKAANYPECCLMLDNGLDCLDAQLEDKLIVIALIAPMKNSCNDQENVEPNVQQRNNLVSAAQLKKKEVQPKSSKRKKSWIDKLQKRKPKPAKSTKQTKKAAKEQKKDDGVHPQVEENGDSNKGAPVELQECSIIRSLGIFTELLTSPSCDLGDENQF